jgi:hypothetical protein
MPNHFDELVFSKFKMNDVVFARWLNDGELYEAKVVTISNDKNGFQYRVRFGDGIEENVNESDILTESEIDIAAEVEENSKKRKPDSKYSESSKRRK